MLKNVLAQTLNRFARRDRGKISPTTLTKDVSWRKLRATERSVCPVGSCVKRSVSHILTAPKFIVSSGHVPEVEQ